MKWIATEQDLAKASESLSRASVIAVDTEADSLHSYYDKVCLIQISVEEEDLVIDPLTKIDLSPFGAILANPGIRKVFHGADYDLRILRRDFGFGVINLVDTMICAQLLGYESFGLSALLKQHFGVDADKSHQRADWSMRPLTPEMLSYATMDTHYLVRLSDELREKLEALGRWEWAMEEFGRLEAVRPKESEDKGEAFRKIKGANRLDRRSLAALALLHEWRDGLARKSDRPPFKIIGNEALVEISRELPTQQDNLRRIKAVAPYHVTKFGRELVAIVEKARGLQDDQLPAKTDAKPWQRDRTLERRTDILKKVRDQIAASLKIEASILAPKHVLTAIAEIVPTDVDQLDAIAAVRKWQKSVAGEAFVNALKTEG